MPAAATLGHNHLCPLFNGPVPHVGGPIIGGSGNVLINGAPAATAGDACTCVGPMDSIMMGSTTVFINGKPAARMGDSTAHGGVIVIGSPTVMIGDSPGMVSVKRIDIAARLSAAMLTRVEGRTEVPEKLVSSREEPVKSVSNSITFPDPFVVDLSAPRVSSFTDSFSDDAVFSLPLPVAKDSLKAQEQAESPQGDRIHLQLVDENGVHYSGIRFLLQMGGKSYNGVTDVLGYIDITLHEKVELEGSVQLWVKASHEHSADVKLAFRAKTSLDAVDTVSGQQVRLNNLGYACGRVDNVFGPLMRAAIRQFQTDHGLKVDGICGPLTQSKLLEIYGH